MNANGDREDPVIAARKVLLDVLEALGEQRRAVILVGAQAIYLQTKYDLLTTAPYTTDADLALDPAKLERWPELVTALHEAGFTSTEPFGTWIGPNNIAVDLLVPTAIGGSGRRSVDLGVHGNRTARKATGLEGALIDYSEMDIGSFESSDSRRYRILVAGTGALLVAKLHKIHERAGNTDRLSDKDALDVYRIVADIPTAEMVARLRNLLRNDVAGPVTSQAIRFLEELFLSPTGIGSVMAGRAAEPAEDRGTISASCSALAGDILRELVKAG